MVGPDDEARACARGARCPVRVVGDAPGAWARVEREPGRPGFVLALAGGGRVEVPLPLAGRHNADNAACALALADWCGVPLEEAARRLAGFAGVGRRMEPRGRAGGVEVVNDYAHHPAEIRATLAAARERGPGPRGRGLPAPPALAHAGARARDRRRARRGRRGRGDRRLPRARAPRPRGHRPRRWPSGCPRPARVVHAPTLAEAADAALAEARPGDLLITMGAGDVTLLGKELVARLEKQSVDGDPDDRSRPA